MQICDKCRKPGVIERVIVARWPTAPTTKTTPALSDFLTDEVFGDLCDKCLALVKKTAFPPKRGRRANQETEG